MPQPETAASELLWGAKAIGNFLGRSVDFVYDLADDPVAPVYKPGGRYCAVKSELMCWIKTKHPAVNQI